MAKTSINIQPVKSGSEEHNKRMKPLDYVRRELTQHNQYWESDSQSARLASIQERYFRTVGQTMQKKATPIREGVVVIQDSTSMDDLRKLADVIKEKFGVEVFQIAIHRDEGHAKSKDWKPNLHAHLVFDWTDQETGKSIKLNRNRMAEMQTITAEVLGMERGKSSDKKHLSAIQYKIDARVKQLKELEKSVGTGAKILSWFGVGELAAIRKELEAANKEIEAQKALLTVHRHDSDKTIAELAKRAENAEKVVNTANTELAKVREENANLSFTVDKLTERLWGRSKLMRETIIGDVLEFVEHPDYRDEWVATWRGYTVATARVQKNGTVDITEWHPDQESTSYDHASNLDDAWRRIKQYTWSDFDDELKEFLGQVGMRR